MRNINNGLIIHFFASRSRWIIVSIYKSYICIGIYHRVFSLTRYVSKRRDKILYQQDRILSRYKRVSSAAIPCVKLRSYASRQLPTAIFQNCNVRRSPITNIIYASRCFIFVRWDRYRCLPQIDLNWKIKGNSTRTKTLTKETFRSPQGAICSSHVLFTWTKSFSYRDPVLKNILFYASYASRRCLE